MPGPKRGSGPRSGLYSESKFTNWARFDPFIAELRLVAKDADPAVRIELGPGRSLPILSRPVREGFVRPFTSEDVSAILAKVPREFIMDLEAVFLLGGTERQRKTTRVRYGTYLHGGRILLHALPSSLLQQYWRMPPKPSVAMQYARFGARFECAAKGWVLQFSSESLRAFYLYDVLLHEVGHHVERAIRPRPGRESERYATWFAEYQAAELRNIA